MGDGIVSSLTLAVAVKNLFRLQRISLGAIDDPEHRQMLLEKTAKAKAKVDELIETIMHNEQENELHG